MHCDVQTLHRSTPAKDAYAWSSLRPRQNFAASFASKPVLTASPLPSHPAAERKRGTAPVSETVTRCCVAYARSNCARRRTLDHWTTATAYRASLSFRALDASTSLNSPGRLHVNTEGVTRDIHTACRPLKAGSMIGSSGFAGLRQSASCAQACLGKCTCRCMSIHNCGALLRTRKYD